MFSTKETIIASIREQQTRYLKKSHKFSIEVPKTVGQALVLDANNGITLWADAISREVKNVRVAFEILPDGIKAPVGQEFV